MTTTWNQAPKGSRKKRYKYISRLNVQNQSNAKLKLCAEAAFDVGVTKGKEERPWFPREEGSRKVMSVWRWGGKKQIWLHPEMSWDETTVPKERLSNHIVWVPQRLDSVIFGFSNNGSYIYINTHMFTENLQNCTCKQHFTLLSSLSRLESTSCQPAPPVPASIKAADWIWTAWGINAEWKRCLPARRMSENHGSSVTFPLKRRRLGSAVQVSRKHFWWTGYCSERRRCLWIHLCELRV